MQKILYLEILGAFSDKGFSLDELVLRTKEVFAKEGMAGIVALILSLLDEQLCIDLLKRESSLRPPPCCKSPHSRNLRPSKCRPPYKAPPYPC